MRMADHNDYQDEALSIIRKMAKRENDIRPENFAYLPVINHSRSFWHEQQLVDSIGQPLNAVFFIKPVKDHIKSVSVYHKVLRIRLGLLSGKESTG